VFYGLFDKRRLHLPVLEEPILGEIVTFDLEDWSRQREYAFAPEISHHGWIGHVAGLKIDSYPFQVRRDEGASVTIWGFV
jgi:hypothetical protein